MYVLGQNEGGRESMEGRVREACDEMGYSYTING